MAKSIHFKICAAASCGGRAQHHVVCAPDNFIVAQARAILPQPALHKTATAQLGREFPLYRKKPERLCLWQFSDKIVFGDQMQPMLRRLQIQFRPSLDKFVKCRHDFRGICGSDSGAIFA